ncbi:hypothetical protein CDL12_01108 [Handroanthus impetiginosus]|uniref:Cytochrome P450 CYP2 subfamily n=1 Tax=Handroanthus impetiginosus TaxID=429701 RepID=A0A2G9I8S1_9LAMI|nr:hypothetical protein CDL12_01108 [Handroanthus impetiginosus]
MTELIRNPKKMTKAINELQTVITKKRHIEESNISKLPYLHAIIKEIFKLHPVVPLLLPHKVEGDIEINSYLVPKNTPTLVNMWAIGRDYNLWSTPYSFEPKRFLGSKIDIRGQEFELIPFGSGIRICVGLPLAYQMVHLVVATLIEKFNWEVEGGIKLEEMNMDEKFELSL